MKKGIIKRENDGKKRKLQNPLLGLKREKDGGAIWFCW
jgi:hypothetical protein